MTENEISRIIIGKSIEIHKELGPGLLESVYEKILAYELINEGLFVKTQVPLPVFYKGIYQEIGFKIDLLVEDKVIVQLKCVESLAPIHFVQTKTYLKLSQIKLGLLINFNTVVLYREIKRIVNNL